MLFQRKNKFRNVKVNGCDSKKEARRKAELQMLEQAGIITDLLCQVKFEIVPKQQGERAAHYIADFQYIDENGVRHVVDVKGYRTSEYILKRKLMLHVHGIKVEEE